MDRREFLIGLSAALIVVPAAITLQGCGSKSSDAPPPAPPTTFSVASSVVFSHSHNVTIPVADLTIPPSGGVTYLSDGASHQHEIFLTEQQLADINKKDGTATVTSTVVNNHTHDWTITKPAF